MSVADKGRESKRIEQLIADRIWVITGQPIADCHKEANTIIVRLLDNGFVIKKERTESNELQHSMRKRSR